MNEKNYDAGEWGMIAGDDTASKDEKYESFRRISVPHPDQSRPSDADWMVVFEANYEDQRKATRMVRIRES